ncbi:NAD(P)/FAD-dependent oxidoreductase [Alkalibacillus aidingensis]|uniref:NAD(P)/FAD-dependent oxidoreductase n=1 Tax=Alkalibacillus aidingensis TaxID=2747607 RepID=UPI001660650E|nr:FAD-binding oxidoreductase [Alkalibacillus aidingensis]
MTYIIIGGGILGASTAYHLAKRNEKVTIIDRFDEGQATEAAAGIVCPWLSQRRNKDWYQLVKHGARYYPDLVEQLEADGETETGYRKVGTISLNTDLSKLEKMVERVKKRREDAPEIGEIKLLNPEETKSMFPPLSEEYHSVYVSGGARVDGRAIRDAMIRASQKHGATFIKGSAELVKKDKRVIGVQVDGQFLQADQVIDTAGAWSKQLQEPIGIDYDVSNQRAQIIHLDMQGENTDDWPVVMPPNNSYLLSFSGGKVVVGATRTDPAEFDSRPTAGGVSEILGKAIVVAPGLEDATFQEVRVGFRPYTPGFLPIIGPMPGYKGLLVSNGLGATGLTAGPYLGTVLADLATGQDIDLDLSAYDVSLAVK